jgi:hypothetical protein
MTKRQKIVRAAQRELKKAGKPKLARAAGKYLQVRAQKEYEAKRNRIVKVLKDAGHDFLRASKMFDAAAVGKHVAGGDQEVFEDAFRGLGLLAGLGQATSKDAVKLTAAFHDHTVAKVLPKIKSRYKGAKHPTGVNIVS